MNIINDYRANSRRFLGSIKMEQMQILREDELNTVGQVKANTLVLGDCLKAMKYIADGSVDAIIADLPYG
jgi:predicted methyltransferase